MEEKNKKHKAAAAEDEDNKSTISKEEKSLFGGRFLVLNERRLGKGSFGTVFLASDTILENIVALKVEVDKKDSRSKLILEKDVLDELSGCQGFPMCYGYGKKDNINYLAMEALGPNLEILYRYCRRNFTLQTICLFAIQAIELLRVFHSKGYIHRDIKPENFTIGLEERSNVIYLIDYGLSKKFLGDKDQHCEYNENRTLIGTARFSSINTHLGIEQSRRDDLESLGYVLIYYLFGQLPWAGLQASTKDSKYIKIMKRKMNMNIEQLTKDHPEQFSIYFHYVKSIKYSEEPDYDYLKDLFYYVLQNYYPKEVYFNFDWTLADSKPIEDRFFDSKEEDEETEMHRDEKIEKEDYHPQSSKQVTIHDSVYSLKYKSQTKMLHDGRNDSYEPKNSMEEENSNDDEENVENDTIYNDNFDNSIKDLELHEALANAIYPAQLNSVVNHPVSDISGFYD